MAETRATTRTSACGGDEVGGGGGGSRMERFVRVVEKHVCQQKIPGAAFAVAKDGETVVEHTVNVAGRSNGDGERSEVFSMDDSLMRCASVSKVITAMAVSILVEEGALGMNDPVVTYIPEFADLRVLATPKGGEDDILRGADAEPDATVNYETEPVNTAMLVKQLLNHSSGLGYRFAPTLYPSSRIAKVLHQEYADKEIFDIPFRADQTSDALIQRLAQCPLGYQPGTRCMYSLGLDVASIIVERVSGQNFDEFVRERICAPLGMTDTYFTVPEEKHSRVMTLYAATPTGLHAFPDDQEQAGALTFHPTIFWANPDVHKSGGGGMVSTVRDLMRFFGSLTATIRGSDRAPHLISQRSAQLMATGGTEGHDGCFVGRGWDFSMGGATLRDPGAAGHHLPKDSYKWGGVYGADWFIAPNEDLFGVFFSQKLPPLPTDARNRFAPMACVDLL